MKNKAYFPPFLSLNQFGEFCGVTLRTVEAWVLRRHVPTLKIGKHRLVNVAALLTQTDLESLKKVSTATGYETVSQSNSPQKKVE